jgi:hypothetical protein
MEIGLEVNADKTKCMVMFRDTNTRRSHDTKFENISFEMVEQFVYLGTTLKSKNFTQEEIKSRLKSVNACYHAVQNLLSSSLLSKNIKIKTYGTTILYVVLYECETLSFTLRGERRLRVSEKRVLRRIIGTKRDEVTEE